MADWYQLTDAHRVDSPALLVYPAKVEHNIALAIKLVGDVNRLRPHVKTNKLEEVCRMMRKEGITKYKCATIAEAEMLAMIEAPDVLLAYQPVGPKIERLLRLSQANRKTRFSCLVDNEQSAQEISACFAAEDESIDVYIDLNVGMNRTGIASEKTKILTEAIKDLPGVKLAGLHAYDGHIHDKDADIRRRQADESYRKLCDVADEIDKTRTAPLVRIIGGTPSFAFHAKRADCECSPGTFVFWDWNYAKMLEELPFEYAAVLLCRVISVIDKFHICVDLGYKAVAAESPLPRVLFLNAPDAIQLSQSEEHLVLKVTDYKAYPVGTVLYAVPSHICPTVALYENVQVAAQSALQTHWEVTARRRKITL